jgi:hypothetical protein
MRSMVKGYVRKAFSLIGDLAEDVVFIDKSTSGFDYSTGEAIVPAAVQHTMRAVVIKETLKDTNVSVTKLLMMTEQFDNAGIISIDTFDQVIVRGHTLNILHSKDKANSISDNGYTISIYAVQEDA